MVHVIPRRRKPNTLGGRIVLSLIVLTSIQLYHNEVKKPESHMHASNTQIYSAMQISPESLSLSGISSVHNTTLSPSKASIDKLTDAVDQFHREGYFYVANISDFGGVTLDQPDNKGIVYNYLLSRGYMVDGIIWDGPGMAGGKPTGKQDGIYARRERPDVVVTLNK